MFLFTIIFQEVLCSPEGVQCYQTIGIRHKSCLIECEGMHADKRKENEAREEISALFSYHYEYYKMGFHDAILYPDKSEGAY